MKRLRIAIELDCDARVVRRIGKPYEYGRMLLAVGEEHANSLPLAASLTGRRPLLERRIHAMMMKRPRRPLLASLPFAVFAFAAVTAATRAPQPAPFNAISATQTKKPYPTREEIAAMLQASVPALSSDTDSSNYALVVLDANNNFVTATAGYGSLMIQIWGDTLESDARVIRTFERTGVAEEPARAAGGGGRGGRGARGRVGGGTGGSIAMVAGSSGGSSSGGGVAVAGGSGGSATGGSIAIVGNGSGSGTGGGGAIAGSIGGSATGSGTGSGGGRGVSSGGGGAFNAITSLVEPAGTRSRRIEWQGSIALQTANGASVVPLPGNQPGNAYSAGIIVMGGPTPATGLYSLNTAPGLHALTAASGDDSAIDGVPASALTSLETFRYASGPFARNDLKVFVVTTNSLGR